jgi:hypothetical protein
MRAPFAISSRGRTKKKPLKTKGAQAQKAKTARNLHLRKPQSQMPQLDELHITPPHVPMTATQLAAVMSAPEKPRARRTLVYGHAAPI